MCGNTEASQYSLVLGKSSPHQSNRRNVAMGAIKSDSQGSGTPESPLLITTDLLAFWVALWKNCHF
jgi:hypothetical protein